MKEETKVKETVTKEVFAGTMQNYTGTVSKRWNKEDASLGYDAWVASFKGLLLTYGKIVIRGIGVFEIKYKDKTRVKNNFKRGDGDWCEVEGRQYISFSPSDVFKEEIKSLEYKFIEEDGGDA